MEGSCVIRNRKLTKIKPTMSRFCDIFSKANINITIFTEQRELKIRNSNAKNETLRNQVAQSTGPCGICL